MSYFYISNPKIGNSVQQAETLLFLDYESSALTIELWARSVIVAATPPAPSVVGGVERVRFA
jgi:hypothetical protein